MHEMLERERLQNMATNQIREDWSVCDVNPPLPLRYQAREPLRALLHQAYRVLAADGHTRCQDCQ